MRVDGESGRVVWSASDLKAAAECEFAWLRALDAKLGRVDAVVEPDNPTQQRAIELGDRHEAHTLERYREKFGGGVVEIERTRSTDAPALSQATAATREALASDADVVFQAAFADADFVGFADFIVRDESGLWVVQDTKLARTARVTALMQLAAYVDQLDRLGIAHSDRVELLLGDGVVSVHAIRDLLPLYSVRRERIRSLIADRRPGDGAAGEALAWGDERGDLAVFACGRCATCDEQVIAHRDLLSVAGMRPSQRQRLREAGIATIDDLAAAESAPRRMSREIFESLRTQARLQVASPAGVPSEHGDAPGAVPQYEVVQPAVLATMPRPNAGDIFFDFEGDPLYSEGSGHTVQWGLDYLFGWVDLDESYSSIWAHTLAEEKAALEKFCDFIEVRRQQHPDLHIYHYAPYEPSHLAAMAARHGVREAQIDQLLREEVFVDLYPIVRRALRVGSRSYSIKKLEPLYMGAEVRTQDVQRGDDSIVRYVQAMGLRSDGDGAAAQQILDDLADYNRYDCVSTRRLRDWLVDRAREAGATPARPHEMRGDPQPLSPVAGELLAASHGLRDARVGAGYESVAGAVEEALRLAAAAIDYYPREVKSFWRAHFQRLREPVGLWSETRDVMLVDPSRSEVETHWHRPERSRSDRRRVRLRGEIAPGTRLSVGAQPFVLYERPAPFPTDDPARWQYVPRQARIVEVFDDGVVIDEGAVQGETWDRLPVALAPASPPPAGNQQSAIDEWARGVAASVAAGGDFPADAVSDLLLRRPPRGRADDDGAPLPIPSDGDDVSAIAATIRAMDRSALAVQGPPGTGKTYVGSHVIADLVRNHGYRIGVVAQSHAVVENMLDRVVAAGVSGDRVAKAPKSTGEPVDASFTWIRKDALAAFADAHPDGFVVGGTAWDFSHAARVPRGSLDLLVIDEAGQFSLASTIAVSVAATRLLLLGDPQQLPQVSQGIHPAPVDESALGWVMAGASVIPPTHGYFLATSWRMHPAVAAAVSDLSYDGKLASRGGAAMRSIEGIDPGVHPISLHHRGNATESPEEAVEVVRLVREVLGRSFVDIAIGSDGTASPRPARALTEADVIVVAPYNAQQQLVEEHLAGVGLGGVRVGTVDKFQGQEAAVAIVTLAASSGRDAPRGVDFLLLQNRLNVAVSRAMVVAYVISSPALLDDLPWRADGVARMSAFARLIGAA